MGVTFVVTNVKLVIVHSCLMFQFSQKETAAGGETSLFGRIITPCLAVFQNIVSNKLIIGNFFSEIRITLVEVSSLIVHHGILRLGKNTLGIAYIKGI